MEAPIAIVLAAGKGTRMKSELPKVLFPVCGRPMVHYVLDALERVGVLRSIVVIGYRGDLVRQELRERSNVQYVEQTEQLGTGHAVQVCREAIGDHQGPVLIVTGDSPLIQSSSLEKLLGRFSETEPAGLMGTLVKPNPHGLGRIVRDAQGRFQRIVEQRDASEDELKICEVNMSTYLFRGPDLLDALVRLTNENAQREYYLTDVPGILLRLGRSVDALPVLEECEALSINTIDELGLVEAQMLAMGYLRA